MNKDFLKTIFHADAGHVYEYTGTVPEGLELGSTEMAAHVTEDFIKGHGDNLVSTMVVHLPYQNNKIILYCNDTTDLNTSDEFVLLTSLVPDVVIEETQEETQEETTQENTQETPGEGQ